MTIFTASNSIRRYCCVDLRRRADGPDAVDDRQKRVPGFSQQALDGATVAVIGAGGLGSGFGWGAVKKGIGHLVIYDGDVVALSNLNRQLYSPRDLGKNKAHRLARNASKAGYLGTRLTAVPCFFQAAVQRGLEVPCDIVFCGVDNDETRAYVARHYLDRPVVIAAVSDDAGHGYAAVQEPGQACFGCFRPQALSADTAVAAGEGACPADPAVIDVVSLVAMLSLYALDSLIMARPRAWNFKQIALHGLFPDVSTVVARRPDCPLCGGATPGIYPPPPQGTSARKSGQPTLGASATTSNQRSDGPGTVRRGG